MKIGILTFHYAHNYGAMLQAYALRTYLNENGHEAEIINYIPKHMRIKYFYINFGKIILLGKRSVIKSYIKQKANIKCFNQFQINYLNVDNKHILSKEQLSLISNEYDIIIIGSDQVWNTNITNNDLSYFGDFLTSAKAVSYAASCGNAFMTDEFSSAISKYKKNFLSISVREQSTKLYLKESMGIDVDCVLDPVFLLKPEQWEKLIKKNKKQNNNKYIFYYSVQKNDTLADECNKYAEQSNCNIVTAHGEMKTMIKNATLLNGVDPIDFINLIYHADCVFTNSFHALVFSIIFNKKVFLRVHSQTGNRITDLLQKCGISWSGEGLLELKNKSYYKLLDTDIKMSKFFLERSL